MQARFLNYLLLVAFVSSLVAVGGIALGGPLRTWPAVAGWLKQSESAAAPSQKSSEPANKLQAIDADTVRLTPEIEKQLGVATAEVKRLSAERRLEPEPRTPGAASRDGWSESARREALRTRRLELNGSLAFEPSHLARIHARFPGEVVEIREVEPTPSELANSWTKPRPLRYGDKVKKGQLLAVIWNTDLGAKKSELVDALAQLRVDQRFFEAYEKGAQQGYTSEAMSWNARRNLEADRNRIASAERTLRVWRTPETEIAAVRADAQRMLDQNSKRDPEVEKSWARVEVRAPFDGVIVEMNIAKHDVVDTSMDLFKIANVESLSVWANVFEEDLPALQNLPPEKRQWKVRLQAEPDSVPMSGNIDVIGYVIDPTQHTALVRGQVDNSDGRLRAGQFVTATLELPPSPLEVAVPISALVEDGRESIVLLQQDPTKSEYTQRRVRVVRRGREVAFLQTRLEPGLRVVTSGAIELKAALEDVRPKPNDKK